MSFRNVHYNKKTSQIHLWDTVKKERMYAIYDWVPYVYTKTDKKTGIKSIYGENVIKKKFSKFWKYRNYQEENFCYENNVMPEIQFLTEWYSDIPDEELEIPELKIFSLDLEIHVESGGFPSPLLAEKPIVLISIYDSQKEKTYTFGQKQFNTSTLDENVKYYQIHDEKDMMEFFLNFIHKEEPDIITGWNIIPSTKMNISGFDIPYIVNRCKMLFGKNTDEYKKLSPINDVRTWYNRNGDMNVDVAGVSLIDYMAAYKWYSRKNPKSYSLDYITKLELGEGKLDYSEYDNLKELYHKNWDLYVDYNIIDSKRIKELEDKLGYIKLIQSLSLVTKCPMKYYQAMTSLLEGKILTYYRRNGYCAPRFKGGEQISYSAAYVKPPQKGLHGWIISQDIASSYPTAIITLNMSMETYVGKISDIPEDKVIYYTSIREFPEFDLHNLNSGKYVRFYGDKLEKFNKMLKKGLLTISPIGTIFKSKPEGVIAHVERDMFTRRKKIKKEMKGVEDKEELGRLDTFQNALKILLNSMYGISAFPYGNRYFNWHISEAIVSCARHTIKQGERFTNELLNNPNEELNKILWEMENL